tara:strand:- start:3198 stop:4304 length:1107 start_codon:yes stop_codon:yes gene_type:complete
MKIIQLSLIIKILYSIILSNTNIITDDILYNSKPFIVVIDAGHGGKDSGNRGNGYYEKNIALEIALKIGSNLRSNNDIKVIYTRKSDVFVDLFQRARIANSADADLFISIHCDSHNSNAYGAGTFVLGLHANDRNFEVAKKENSVIFYEENYEENYDGFDPNNPESVIGLTLMQETYLDQSIIAAATIQKHFVNDLGRKNRTVKQAGFIVLKYTYMPSVLIETGFLTNKNEGAYLNSEKGQNAMAKAISNAIIDYKNDIMKSLQESYFFDSNEKNSHISDVVEKINYKIQVAASSNKIETKSFNFNGLKSISREKSGEIYRYYFGNTYKYKAAKKILKTVKNKGYKSAFIVAFRGNKKISIKEAQRNE